MKVQCRAAQGKFSCRQCAHVSSHTGVSFSFSASPSTSHFNPPQKQHSYTRHPPPPHRVYIHLTSTTCAPSPDILHTQHAQVQGLARKWRRLQQTCLERITVLKKEGGRGVLQRKRRRKDSDARRSSRKQETAPRQLLDLHEYREEICLEFHSKERKPKTKEEQSRYLEKLVRRDDALEVPRVEDFPHELSQSLQDGVGILDVGQVQQEQPVPQRNDNT